MAWTPGKYCQGIQSTEFNQTASCDSPFVPQYDTDVVTAGPIHVNAGTDVNGANGTNSTEADGANDTDGMNGIGANGTNSTNGNDINGMNGTDVNGRNGTNGTDVNGTTGADKCIFTIKRQKVDDVDCYPPRLEFSYWMAWCTYTWTWLYISTQNIWIVFVFVLIFHPRYGKLKLGADDDQPEFTNMEWFAMIFCCGVATGLFYFSIGEPINHYEPCGKWAFGGPDGADWGTRQCLGTSNWANRFSHLPDNERAQKAMELTFYHWGLHGWVCYAIVGCILGILHFRKGLPMTMKTCFYPLLGERIYGFMGDLIDVLSIVCTTFGVCTSLGMGVQQINAGIKMLSGGTNWLGVKWYGVENQDEWYNDYKDSAKDIWDIQKESWRLSNPWSVATAGLVSQRMTEVSEQILLIWFITTASTARAVCIKSISLNGKLQALAAAARQKGTPFQGLQLIRDPRHVLDSQISLKFSAKESVESKWQRICNDAETDTRTALEAHTSDTNGVQHVCYEDMVTDPVGVTQRVYRSLAPQVAYALNANRSIESQLPSEVWAFGEQHMSAWPGNNRSGRPQLSEWQTLWDVHAKTLEEIAMHKSHQHTDVQYESINRYFDRYCRSLNSLVQCGKGTWPALLSNKGRNLLVTSSGFK